MTVILNVGRKNGKVEQYGPFPSDRRAREYAASVEDIHLCWWHIKELIVPFSVVKNIIWRES